MILEIFWPDSQKELAFDKFYHFKEFIQQQANRLIVGVYRYDKGRPTKAAKFLTRLEAEVAEYRRTGNTEHLINAANYCFLESFKPEHPKSHFKHVQKSVTRDKLKMKIHARGGIE